MGKDVTPGLDVDGALRMHQELSERLEGLVDGEGEGDGRAVLDASAVSSDSQCALGKWIHGNAVLRYARLEEFGALRDAHAQFHSCAGNVLVVRKQGNQAAARALLNGAMRQASNALRRGLDGFCVVAARFSREKDQALALASRQIDRKAVQGRSLWILAAGAAAVAVWRLFQAQAAPNPSVWDVGLQEVLLFFAIVCPAFYFLVLRSLLGVVEHLQTLEGRLATTQAAMEALPAMLITDSNAMIVRVNRTFTEITGFAPDDVLGKTPRLLKSDKQDAAFFAQMWRGLAETGFWHGTLWNKRKDGGEFLADLTVSALRAELGETVGYVATYTDLTEQRGALLAAQVDAPAQNSRSEFLGHMGHELRTPMNAVLGFIDLALGEPLDEKLRRYLQRVRDAGQSMMGKIDDILDLSRIESGSIDLDSAPFDLAAVCTGAYRKALILVTGTAIRMDSSIDDAIPSSVIGDPLRVGQIVNILLGNAIKFTDSGKVTLTVKLHRLSQGIASIGIAVEDTGIGMDSAQISGLFLPFAKARTSALGRHGGSGLGLTIAKSLVEQMGGTIAVESSPGKGSTFRVVLSLPVTGAATAAAEGAATTGNATFPGSSAAPVATAWAGIEVGRYAGKRVLVAEDDEANQALIRVVLEKLGCSVAIAHDGREAVRMVAESTEPFDLVMMDIRMPEMGGIEATRIIRARHPMDSLPIVAFSANASEEDRQKSLNAGMNEHLNKPLQLDQLMQVLERLFA